MRVLRGLIGILIPCIFLCGCALKLGQPPHRAVTDLSWTERAVTKKELLRASSNDPDLSPEACQEILARLNIKTRHYIAEDIEQGNKLKVPNHFSAYKNWTPLPTHIPEVNKLPRFILIVKDIPFLGWYEKGSIAGDTQICIGKKKEWTKAGIYKVLNKDENHFSGSYRNAYDLPAPMPWALRIYGHVWIHAGDIEGGYCSRGCVNLPWRTAEKVFHWAKLGTLVLVVESTTDLQAALAKHSKRLRM